MANVLHAPMASAMSDFKPTISPDRSFRLLFGPILVNPAALLYLVLLSGSPCLPFFFLEDFNFHLRIQTCKAWESLSPIFLTGFSFHLRIKRVGSYGSHIFFWNSVTVAKRAARKRLRLGISNFLQRREGEINRVRMNSSSASRRS